MGGRRVSGYSEASDRTYTKVSKEHTPDILKALR